MYIYGRWIVIPLIGAFIGWITNVLAIRLLFRPHRPFQFLFWTFQGLIPKRRAEIAANVARVVDKDLLPSEKYWSTCVPQPWKRRLPNWW